MPEPHYSFDLLVVGGGPAGMAAASSATRCGMAAGIVDDNPGLGGQIWRSQEAQPTVVEAERWIDEIRRAKVTRLQATSVVARCGSDALLAETSLGPLKLSYRKLVLATGARERFLPFPGWTLRNVMGAGGLQAMVKAGLPIAGKRVVVAGTGPLLLAAADYLQKKGAVIPLVAEQTSWSRLLPFGVSLLREPAKLFEAIQLRNRLRNILYRASCWPVQAMGSERVEKVLLRDGGKLREETVDYLACGFHLVPNVELPALLGCRIHQGAVAVDQFQRTSLDHVYCAGEPTGIGGLDLSLVEGKIAGLAAAGQEGEARSLFSQRNRYHRFARTLEQAFELRAELRSLPQNQTMVCRCEDVRYEAVREHSSFRSAKLHTRCGMGACQSRVCGPALRFLMGWKDESVRPPIFSARMETLAAECSESMETVSGGKQ